MMLSSVYFLVQSESSLTKYVFFILSLTTKYLYQRLPSLLKKQVKLKSFKRDLNLECGIVVYKVEKSYDLTQEIV